MNTIRSLQVVVIGDSQADKDKYRFCEELGKYLGEMGHTVITGGRSGVMEAVSKGAYNAGGITVGILPGSNMEDANPWCKVVIPTDLGNARNSLTALSGDLVISVGGGAGTLTELGFAWLYRKPIIAVTTFGGWSEKISGERIDNRRTDDILPVNTMQELKIQIERIDKRFKKL